ncbi:MAG: DUF4159 domain-containing protein [Myxococcales bacterium]|nr:DUF4159 domain-containing protein [Myxococcales bacterium]
MIDRRRFLAGAGAGLLLPGTSLGFGQVTRVDVAELDLPGSFSRPSAWKRLLYEVESTTSVEVDGKVVRVKPDDPELFEHPFTVLMGQDAFEIDEAGVEQLGRYLAYGGFLYVDDTTGSDSSGFDDSVKRLARRLFPTRPLAPVPRDHSIYRSFFLIDRPVGRIDRQKRLDSVTVGNLAPLVYSRNDVSGALERRENGSFVHACVPGGENQRREALKLGINLVLYSLTANYKRDQAHVVALKNQGRLE